MFFLTSEQAPKACHCHLFYKGLYLNNIILIGGGGVAKPMGKEVARPGEKRRAGTKGKVE